MITIEYSRSGNAFTDFQAEETARAICHVYEETKEDAIYVVGNETFIDAMKLMVVENKIQHDHLQFKFKEEILRISELGEIEKYPKGFCDQATDILKKLVDLRREKIKKQM